MSQQLLGLGTVPNDGTGDTLRAGGTKINANFTELYDYVTLTVNAATYAGATYEAKITAAIADAVATGKKFCFVTGSYNPSLVTFNSGIRMLCQGGDPATYDAQAYGADPTGTADATLAINTAIAAAVANGAARCVIRTGIYSLTTFATTGDGLSTRALVVTGPCEVIGVGEVWLKNTNATGATMLRVNDNPQTAPVSRVRIEGLGFDGNGMQQGVGLQVFNVQDSTIRGNKFKNFSNLSVSQFSYGIRVEGWGTPANPFVWSATLPSGFSRGVRVEGNSFDGFTNGAAGSANAIFHYQTDGCLTERNVIHNCGLASMTYGPNRRHSVLHNELSDGWDNGIRFEQDVTGDLQRNREHTVMGNVIRNMTVDGIRLNCSRTTCKGNISVFNQNSGIKADNSEMLNIEGNECHANGNRGIYLAQASITGQLSHLHATISNNDCHSNGGDGIGVYGGSPNNLIPAISISIRNNRCRFNHFNGIVLQDADDTSSIMFNVCEQNGDGGVSFTAGIEVVASLLSWGGATIAFNRCFDTTAAPNAKQPIGIWLRPVAGGVTLQKCYCYFNDCSDAQNSGSYFAAAIATNYGVTGTQSGHLLVGTLYRNVTRGVTITQVGVSLTTNDIIVQVDESGFFGVTQKGLSGISADRGDASVTVQAGVDNEVQFFNTPLTAARTITLSATGAYNGARFRVVRSAAATGASTLTVQTLLGGNKALTVGQALEAHWNGAAWVETTGAALL